MKKIYLLLSIVFVLPSCTSDSSPAPKDKEDMEEDPEIESVYQIDILLYGITNEEDSTYSEREFSFRVKGDEVTDLATNEIVSEIDIESFLSPTDPLLLACGQPIAAINIVVEKKEGESLEIEDLTLDVSSISEIYELIDIASYEVMDNSIAFMKDPNNSSKSSFSLELRYKCSENTGGRKPFRSDDVTWKINLTQKVELFDFSYRSRVKPTESGSSYFYQLFTSFTESSETKKGLITVDKQNSIGSNIQLPEILLARKHFIGKDPCPQAIGTLEIESSLNATSPVTFEPVFADYSYKIANILEEESSNEPQVSFSTRSTGQTKLTVAASFTCSAPVDANVLTELKWTQRVDRYLKQNLNMNVGSPQILNSMESVVIQPLRVTVDVQ